MARVSVGGIHTSCPQYERVGLMSATMLVIANTIGVGVFTTSGLLLQELKTPILVLIAWLIGGVIAICGAISYGALARRIPESGGEYVYLANIFHPCLGFIAGWVSLLAGFTAPIAAAAHGLQAYLVGSDISYHPEWIGTIAILLAGFLHGFRLETGVFVQNFIVLLKLALLIVFILVAYRLLPTPVLSAETGLPEVGISTFGLSLVWVFYAYSGWNAAVYITSEMRSPKQNLNRALLLGTGTVVIIYLLLNSVFLFAVPESRIVGKIEVGAIAAETLGGEPFEWLVSLLIVLALFTSILSMVMTGPRVYARMAEDGVFPKLFKVRNGAPKKAIFLQISVAITVLWLYDIVELLNYCGFMLGLSSMATVFGLFVLRRKEGASLVPIPGYPWVPGFFIFATLSVVLLMCWQKPLVVLWATILVIVALPMYFFRR